jgi:hypothetical protein
MPRPYFAAQNSCENAKNTDNLGVRLLRPRLYCGLSMQTDKHRSYIYRTFT